MPKTSTTMRTKGRTAQRRPAPQRRREWPILPLSVGGVFSVVFIALLVFYYIASRGPGGINGQPVGNIKCEANEQVAVHYHAHLTLIYHGEPATIPAQTGIITDSGGNVKCFYWMHTHTTSGIVHIEAPKGYANTPFTVGDFFKIWDQPLTSKKIATFPLAKGDEVKVWVDGQPYTGDPAKIPLKSHTQVVIQVGPPFTDPPPSFDWTSPDAVQEAGTS